jgi:hypothetical protein
MNLQRILIRLSGIFVSTLPDDVHTKTTLEIETLLRKTHKPSTTGLNDFNVRSQQVLSSMLISTSDILTILTAWIVGISLLVGSMEL